MHNPIIKIIINIMSFKYTFRIHFIIFDLHKLNNNT